MAITLRQLEIFAKVAASGQVTRASEILFIGQSAVSMSISELEKSVDGPLFERLKNRLILNDRGRMLLPEAIEILRKASAIETALKESTREPMGTLHVGSSTTIGNYLLPALLGEFSKRYPKSKVLLEVGNTEQIETGVENGEFDLGMIEGPSRGQTLKSIPWRDDELIVIAGPKHPWARKRKATLLMLAEEEWIIREKGSGTREVFERSMKNKSIGFKVAMELGHTEAIKKAVEAGLGISCLSRFSVQRELDNQWLLAIQTPLNLRRKLMILVRNDLYRSRLFNTFLQMLLE